MRKTREQLLAVAQSLFARKGISNTTMNDIAEASHKVRRTLYTYFKSKADIYQSLVDQETRWIMAAVEKAESTDLPADEKILALITNHLEAVKEVVRRNGSLHAEFFRDICRVESARKVLDHEEAAIIQRILREGNEKQIFHIDNIDITVDIIHYCVKGIEAPFIRGLIGGRTDDGWNYVKKIVYGALGCQGMKQEN